MLAGDPWIPHSSNSATTQIYQQALEISILYVFYSQMAVFCSLYFKALSVHLCNYLYLLLLHYNVMSIFNFSMELLDFCSVTIKVM